MRNPRRRLSKLLCGILIFLGSGTSDFIITVAHASELDSQFKGKRQEIRNLELKATQAMIAAAPACDIFENKLSQLMAAAGPKLVNAPSTAATAASALTGVYNSAAFADSNAFQFSNPGAAQEQAQQQYQNNQQAMGDATAPAVDFQATTKVSSAKDLGLSTEVATVIDSSPEISKLLEETYVAAQTCKPLYTTMVDAESALTTAVNQWIDLAQQINPTAGTGPRLEANGMWVAVKIRRAAHTAMHTTIPDLKDLAACSGDLFIQQSIPNLFQGLANAEHSVVMKSIEEIMKQSQCLDIKQLVALDSAITWGMIASILAFHSEANAPLRKHLLEGLVMAGAPILETTKVLGPTGLWMLTQRLLTKEGAHPDYWLLNTDSFLVSYGITVPSREGPQAVTFPICPEDAPVATSVTTYATPPTPAKPASQEEFAKPIYNFPSFESLFGNSTKTTPQVIPVDPEEAPLAYGYTLKELKALICPAAPTISPGGQYAAGPLNKGYLGKCYKSKEITDSYRGDHLGYATCSLPEMMANGYVCKTKLCDAPKSGPTGPFAIENPFGGEAPKPTLPTGCGMPGFQGIPAECQLAGKGSPVFAHATNTQDCADYKQLNFVADSKDEKKSYYDFEPMVIIGKGPGEGSAESQSSTGTSTDKTTVDKPEKATQPDSQQQPATPAYQPIPPAGTVGLTLPPPAKNKVSLQDKDLAKLAKILLDGPPPVPKPSEFATETAFLLAIEKLKELKQKLALSESEGNASKHDLLTYVDSLRYEIRALESAILNSKFRLPFKPIVTGKDFSELVQEYKNLKSNCSEFVCQKKTADLAAHIGNSPYVQTTLKNAAQTAKDILANPTIKKAMKLLREQMLGKLIDPDDYDTAYKGMLNLMDMVGLKPDMEEKLNTLGYTTENNIVGVVLFNRLTIWDTLDDDGLVNTAIHEYLLHILSRLLGLYGYDFEGKPDEGYKASHPDHQLGIQLQDLTGIAMGYVAPPLKRIPFVGSHSDSPYKIFDYEGYKKFLSPSSGGSGSGGSASSSGGSGSGGSSGGSSGGGSPQKDCPPDSPNCGGFSPCQLASLAASAKCDMAMGKPGLKLIPGGGLTAPEPKLNKSLADWIACLFPEPVTGYDQTDVFCQEIGGQITCTEHTYHVGGIDEKCEDKLCAEGYIPTQDSKTGKCSCKAEGAGGDPWQGYRGGQDDCQLIICTDNSTHPCCQPSSARKRRLNGLKRDIW